MIKLKSKILLVDDEPDVLEFLRLNLEKEGFQVQTANNGQEAILKASNEKPDLILLDIMMPEMDGVEVCSTLREQSDHESTMIAFLTARGENYSEIAAFDAGADDYIVKPIRINVLLKRINALLKRKLKLEDQSQPIQTGDLTIDQEKMIVIKNGEVTYWQNKEFQLLCLLSDSPGKVFSRDEIYREVWENETVSNYRIIDVYIRRIREKIGNEHIATIIGKGYKFVN